MANVIGDDSAGKRQVIAEVERAMGPKPPGMGPATSAPEPDTGPAILRNDQRRNSQDQFRRGRKPLIDRGVPR